jgi:hypothetical protein
VSLPTVSRTSFRRTPLGRWAGSFLSWFIFAASVILLVQSTFGVMALGGSCASGGPYEIAVECPDGVALFAPLSVFTGLFSIVVAVFLAQGWGVSLIDLAWPILFCGLGSIFLLEFFATGDPVGIILGVMFVTMGLVPLVLSLRASAQRVFLGAVNGRGERFYEGENPRNNQFSIKYPLDGDTVRATAFDWLASLATAVVAGSLGYWVALKLFGAA